MTRTSVVTGKAAAGTAEEAPDSDWLSGVVGSASISDGDMDFIGFLSIRFVFVVPLGTDLMMVLCGTTTVKEKVDDQGIPAETPPGKRQ
jgi:hypothetical protein